MRLTSIQYRGPGENRVAMSQRLHMRRRNMLRTASNPRRLLYLACLICFLYGILSVLRTMKEGGFSEQDLDRSVQLKELLAEFNRSTKAVLRDVGQVCRRPDLPVNSPEIMKFIRNVPKLDCGPEKNWVEANGSIVYITDVARLLHGDIECSFTDVLRNNEYTTRDGMTTSTHTQHNLEASDFVKVDCRSENGDSWNNIVAGVRHSEEIMDRIGWDQVPSDSLKLSVVMFGIDSISRNNFVRKLPLAYKFLTEELSALVLEGYNIVGDGTPQALIPILTGKTELELPETRKRKGSKATHVDVYPFIWKEFQANGYATAYTEDQPDIGTFTYRLKGFKDAPVDHYGRSFYLSADNLWHNFKQCIGSIESHNIMLQYTRNIMSFYRDKPHFVLSFLAQMSHDNVNLVGAVDEDLYFWLVYARNSGLLNNTLLIIFSDHGPRFADIRNSIQGKLEERLPFFSFTFPSWFKEKHRDAYDNFVANTKQLTTPFDIHATLKDIIHFPQNLQTNDLKNRAMSLFKKIPLSRSCADAQIEAHWCACLNWDEVPITDAAVVAGAQVFVNFLNDYTLTHRDICDELGLKEIMWAAKLRPNEKLLAFHHSKDADGFVPDFSSRQKVSKETIQLKIKATPGDGIFEASMVHDIHSGRYNMRIQDVSRINKYGSQAFCVHDTDQDLRKYCHCKEKPA